MEPDIPFIFPYATDKELKRQQIWSNLQKGILLEDTGKLIPWSTPFSALDKLAEQRKDSGDRTNWFLGEHTILDNYSCKAEVMKWLFVNDSDAFSEINEWLGYDEEGYKKFLFLKEKLTDLLGAPSTIELEKFGPLELGNIEWANGKARIYLVGIEQFACKYWLHVGLKQENK